MCSIFGWYGQPDKQMVRSILRNGSQRGRDGVGVWCNGETRRYMQSDLIYESMDLLIQSNKVVGNFRATPTTEAISSVKNLQPYDGIVHNGTISNDKDLGEAKEIDSMILADVLEDVEYQQVWERLKSVKGSYAIAFFNDYHLNLACNYKPIYYCWHKETFYFASTPEMLCNIGIKMDPYSTLHVELNTRQVIKKKYGIPKRRRVLVAASSGLDSTTVAYILNHQMYDVTLVHFEYGCLAESNEVERIIKIAEHGKFDLKIIDMPRRIMKGTITEKTYHKGGVEGTEYAHDWVSARNLLMLSMLTAYAESEGYDYIAFGGNLEESGAYPDNEQEFGRLFNMLLPYATQNGKHIQLLQPVAHLMKHEIVKVGQQNNVPFELTWSCYSDEEKHCGECGPCYMRKTAFERNDLQDPVFEV